MKSLENVSKNKARQIAIFFQVKKKKKKKKKKV